MIDSPMRHPAARRMLIARTISGAGSWMQVAAASWWVLAVTGQATSVGFLAAAAVIPAVVGSPVGGALSDRYSPAKLLALFSVLSAVPPILVGVLAFGSELTVPWLYALVFFGSIPASMANPLFVKIMPMTVPRELRSSAIADSSVAFNMARLIGPLVGSVLVVTLGVGLAFIVNGLSYLIMFLAVRFTKLPYEAEQIPKENASRKFSYRRGVLEGWSFSVARVAIVGGAIFFALIAPVQQLLASVARSHGESHGYVGLLFSALALGGVLINSTIKKQLKAGTSRRFLINIGFVTSGLALFAMGFSSQLLVDVVLLIFLGAAWELVWVAAQTGLAIHLPPHLSGRMLGLFYGVTTLGLAVGAIAMGVLFDQIGTRETLVGVGVVITAYALLRLLHPSSTRSESLSSGPSYGYRNQANGDGKDV